jgi:hypothetical protein
LSSITDPVVKNNISIINEKPCCICPLAKFHRLPFSYSTHHARNLLKLYIVTYGDHAPYPPMMVSNIFSL